MRAIALLKPKVKVTAVICATENMPSGKAQKPGDVQISMSGKRSKYYQHRRRRALGPGRRPQLRPPTRLHSSRDAATLTGTGRGCTRLRERGIFASDDQMYERFANANKQAGEKMWRLPLDDEYKETLKSNIADMVNAGRPLGRRHLRRHVPKRIRRRHPWIHLDIAGTAWMEEAKPWIAKGPSGIALRSLVEFVKGWES